MKNQFLLSEVTYYLDLALDYRAKAAISYAHGDIANYNELIKVALDYSHKVTDLVRAEVVNEK